MQIRIRQYTFTLSEPYRAGHVINAAEAQAMNSLRAENVRNNMAKVVGDELAVLADGKLLSAEQQAELQARITDYDGKYQFVERHRPAAGLGPIEKEALTIAEERVRARFAQAGDLPDELRIRNETLAEATTAEVQELARRAVGLRLSIAQNAADDLMSL